MDANLEISEEINCILNIRKLFERQEAEGNVVRKSVVRSVKVRKDANRIYTAKHNRGKEDHKKILALYSESIALAPKNSEEFATACSNRSALLMHLKLPEKSLIDINRALEITKSENLKTKLLARKIECLQMKDNPDKSQKYSSLKDATQKLELPSFESSQEIPCAAECVTIAYSKNFGRHFIATRDIKPGEVIIVEEGYTIFPKVSTLYLICSHCLAFAWNGIPCDYCALALYCSEECKNKAWKEYHDEECSILPFLLSKVIPSETDMRALAMTARFFIRAIKSEGLENILIYSHMIDNKDDMHIQGLLSNGIYDNKKFKFCYSLQSFDAYTKQNTQIISKYMLCNLLLTQTSLLDKYKIIENGNLKIINEREFIEIKNIITKIIGIHFQGSLCDCHVEGTCNDMCTGKRGSFFGSCSSLINHSCHPNISRMFMPERKIVIFTTCPVKKGEQLCDTYGSTIRYGNTWERKMSLKHHHGFSCKCQACSENWDRELPKLTKLKFQKLNPKWYKNRFLKPNTENWPLNKKTMKEVTEASELAYQSFDAREAYLLSIPCRDYIDNTFYKFYGERCNIPDEC